MESWSPNKWTSRKFFVFFFLIFILFYWCVSFCLHCVFIASVSRGYSLVVVSGLLIAVASLFLSTGSGVHGLQHAGSVAVAHGPWRVGSVVVAHGLSCTDMWGPGIKPMSTAFAGRFLSTTPPRKSPRFIYLFIFWVYFLYVYYSWCIILYVTGIQYSDSWFLNVILHYSYKLLALFPMHGSSVTQSCPTLWDS